MVGAGDGDGIGGDRKPLRVSPMEKMNEPRGWKEESVGALFLLLFMHFLRGIFGKSPRQIKILTVLPPQRQQQK